ncbi:MAG: hypothetical protein WCS92_05645 [Candidatus Babeliales bacterium]|jgi:hypothetical protein
MKSLKSIAIIFVITAFYSNTYCATKPPADIKGNLTTLKQSLGRLKTKLDSLSKKLGSIKTKLLDLKKPQVQIDQGASGFWIPFEDPQIFGIPMGIKFFKENATNATSELIIEYHILKHLLTMYDFITKKINADYWNPHPFTTLFYAKDFSIKSPYDEDDKGFSEIHMKREAIIDKEKGQRPNIAELPYLIMENYKRDISCKKKIHETTSKTTWNAKLKTFSDDLFSAKKFTANKEKYLTQLKIKLGQILLLFYFMGITTHDCDMFIFFDEKLDRGYFKDNITDETLKKAPIANILKATGVKLIDFGESRLFYTNNAKTIIRINKIWYDDKTNTNMDVKKAIDTKIQIINNEFGSAQTFNDYESQINEQLKNGFNPIKDFNATEKAAIKTLYDFVIAYEDSTTKTKPFANLYHHAVVENSLK